MPTKAEWERRLDANPRPTPWNHVDYNFAEAVERIKALTAENERLKAKLATANIKEDW